MLDGDPQSHKLTLQNCGKDIGYYNLLADAVHMTPILGNAVKQSYTIALGQVRADQYLPRVIDAIAQFNGVAPKS